MSCWSQLATLRTHFMANADPSVPVCVDQRLPNVKVLDREQLREPFVAWRPRRIEGPAGWVRPLNTGVDVVLVGAVLAEQTDVTQLGQRPNQHQG